MGTLDGAFVGAVDGASVGAVDGASVGADVGATRPAYTHPVPTGKLVVSGSVAQLSPCVVGSQ